MSFIIKSGIVVLVILTIYGITMCSKHGLAEGYSEGDRIGVIRKFSEKGLIFKSYEGEMMLAMPEGYFGQADTFLFSVPKENKKIANKIMEGMKSGKRCKLRYSQYLLSPIYLSSSYVITDVEILEK